MYLKDREIGELKINLFKPLTVALAAHQTA